MAQLTSAQQAYLTQHINDQTDTELLAALLGMSDMGDCGADDSPTMTAQEVYAAGYNPWIGDDGQLVDIPEGTRYPWQEL